MTAADKIIQRIDWGRLLYASVGDQHYGLVRVVIFQRGTPYREVVGEFPIAEAVEIVKEINLHGNLLGRLKGGA